MGYELDGLVGLVSRRTKPRAIVVGVILDSTLLDTALMEVIPY